MTGEAMPPARRRPIPGMTAAASALPPPQSPSETESAGSERPSAAVQAPGPSGGSRRRARDSASSSAPTNGGARQAGPTGENGSYRRRPAADYATTRLVNFRIPVDLHDRYRQLVREAEQRHPRLRHPSLTELVIALLEEGPATGDEVADLIRRKRAAEHGVEMSG
jgi:hypothetical protein